MTEDITQTNIVLVPRQNLPSRLSYYAQAVLRLILAKSWLVLLVTFVFFAASFVWSEWVTPEYEAQASIRLLPDSELTSLASTFSEWSLFITADQKQKTWDALRSLDSSHKLKITPTIHSNVYTLSLRQSDSWDARHSLDQILESYKAQLEKKRTDQTLDNNWLQDELKNLRSEKIAAQSLPILKENAASDFMPSSATDKIATEENISTELNAENLELLRQSLQNPEKVPPPAYAGQPIRDLYEEYVMSKIALQKAERQADTNSPDLNVLKSNVTLLRIQLQRELAALVNEQENILAVSASLHLDSTQDSSPQAYRDWLKAVKQDGFPWQASPLPFQLQGEIGVSSRPVFPNKPLVLLLVTLVGFVLGLCLATVVGFQDEKITRASEIENEFHVPVLGVMPQMQD